MSKTLLGILSTQTRKLILFDELSIFTEIKIDGT